MIGSQLILLEGMPSAGKTTNARFLQIQLERNHINAQWIHEVAMPHPVLFFDEAGLTHDEYARLIKKYPLAADCLNHIAVFRKSTVGIHLPEIQWYYPDVMNEDVYQALLEYDVWKFPLDLYKKYALEKWAGFVEKAHNNQDKVYIVDSAIFQYQIFNFLFTNRPYEELKGFIDQIIQIIRLLNPCLIYLYRQNTEATIDYLEKDRGTAYLDYIWDRDKSQPYYAGKPPGAEGFKQFLRDYGKMASLLFDSFPLGKLPVEISDENWACFEDKMLSFLDVSRVCIPDASPQSGIYVNKALGFEIKVDGLIITDPTGKIRKLYQKSHNEFYVDWLPTVLRFEDNSVIISGGQIGDRWSQTNLIYHKIKL